MRYGAFLSVSCLAAAPKVKRAVYQDVEVDETYIGGKSRNIDFAILSLQPAAWKLENQDQKMEISLRSQ